MKVRMRLMNCAIMLRDTQHQMRGMGLWTTSTLPISDIFLLARFSCIFPMANSPTAKTTPTVRTTRYQISILSTPYPHICWSHLSNLPSLAPKEQNEWQKSANKSIWQSSGFYFLHQFSPIIWLRHNTEVLWSRYWRRKLKNRKGSITHRSIDVRDGLFITDCT